MCVYGIGWLDRVVLTFIHETTLLGVVDGLVSSGQADRIIEGFDAATFGPRPTSSPVGLPFSFAMMSKCIKEEFENDF